MDRLPSPPAQPKFVSASVTLNHGQPNAYTSKRMRSIRITTTEISYGSKTNQSKPHTNGWHKEMVHCCTQRADYCALMRMSSL